MTCKQERGSREKSSPPACIGCASLSPKLPVLEVLRRLSALNRQRYQEEQDAARSLEATQSERLTLRKRAGRPAAKKAAAPSAQPQLFE